MRNLWSFGQVKGEHIISKNKSTKKYGSVVLKHPKLGEYNLNFDAPKKWLFTNNETNKQKIFNVENDSPYVKDLFHDAVIENNFELTDAISEGTKFAPLYQFDIPAGGSKEVKLRFSKKGTNSNIFR